MVGDHNAVGTGLHGLLGASLGHDALEDKGRVRRVAGLSDLAQLRDVLGTCWWLLPPEEGKPCAIDIHGNGNGMCRQGNSQLVSHHVLGPRLYGADATAIQARNGATGSLVERGGEAVTRPPQRPCPCSCTEHHVVVGLHVVLGAVVAVHVTQRANHHGQRELAPKDRHGSVRHIRLVDGVHVNHHRLPGLIVANGHRPRALCARARNAVAAGPSIADRTRLAVAHLSPSGLCQLRVAHASHEIPPYEKGRGSPAAHLHPVNGTKGNSLCLTRARRRPVPRGARPPRRWQPRCARRSHGP